MFDRYQTTGDAIRLVSKFGSFTFSPAVIKYSSGNTIGGACDSTGTSCTTQLGEAGVSEYSLSLLYENPEEDFSGGVNLIKRIAGAAQDPDFGYLGLGEGGAPSPEGMN